MPLTIAAREVLPVLPDPPEEWPEGVALPGTAVETPGGNVVATTLPDRFPGTTHALRWVCETRAALVELEAFLMARRGAFALFWLPVVRRDLELLAITDAGATWTVRAPGYAEHVFPDASQRRVLALTPGGWRAAYAITAAVDNGDGTETWSMAGLGSEGVGALAAGIFLAPLVAARLVDGWAVAFETREASVVTAEAIEVPA